MANSYDMQENLFQAIDTIVQSRIASLPYDKTIECKIIDISKAMQNKYTVSYQATTFECSSLVSNLKINDLVYVAIPENDFRQDKIILAKKQKTEIRTVKVLPFLSFIKGANLFSTTQNLTEYSLPINGSNTGNPFVFTTFYGSDLAAGYTRLGIKMAVNSDIKEEIVSGDYGLLIKIYGYDQTQFSKNRDSLLFDCRQAIINNSDDERYCRVYYFNKKDMISTNIYNTHGYANQEKVIDITNFVIDNITITLWQDGNFKNSQNGLITNKKIAYNNLQLYLGYDIKEFGNSDTKIQLYTEDGLLYNNTESEASRTKQVFTRYLIKDDNNNYTTSLAWLYDDAWRGIWEEYDNTNTEVSDISNKIGFVELNNNLEKQNQRSFILSPIKNMIAYLFTTYNIIRKEEQKYTSNTLWFISENIKEDFNFDNAQEEDFIEVSSYTLSGDYFISDAQDNNILRINDKDGNLLLRLNKSDTSYFTGISDTAYNYSSTAGNIGEKFIALDQDITNINNRINSIINDNDDDDNNNNESNNTSIVVESYFQEELEDTITKVKALQTNQCLTFLVCTDIHYGSHDTIVFPHTITNMRAFAAKVPTDGIICLGDITDGELEKDKTRILNNIVMSLFESTNLPLYFAAGNHDCNPRYDVGWPRSESFTTPEMYKEYYSRMCQLNINPDLNSYGVNYYKDFIKQKIRLISIDCANTDELVNTSYKYPADTINWFANTLWSTPDNYTVLLISHLSPYPDHNGGHTVPYNAIDNDDNEENGLNGLQSKINIWLSDNSSHKIISFIGHSHGDWETTNPYLEIMFDCNKGHTTEYWEEDDNRSQWDYPPRSRGWARSIGTVTEDSWTAVVINPTSRKIDCIRFGAGVDRTNFNY